MCSVFFIFHFIWSFDFNFYAYGFFPCTSNFHLNNAKVFLWDLVVPRYFIIWFLLYFYSRCSLTALSIDSAGNAMYRLFLPIWINSKSFVSICLSTKSLEASTMLFYTEKITSFLHIFSAFSFHMRFCYLIEISDIFFIW